MLRVQNIASWTNMKSIHRSACHHSISFIIQFPFSHRYAFITNTVHGFLVSYYVKLSYVITAHQTELFPVWHTGLHSTYVYALAVT